MILRPSHLYTTAVFNKNTDERRLSSKSKQLGLHKEKKSTHTDSLHICSENTTREMTGQYVLTVLRSNRVPFVPFHRERIFFETVVAINTKPWEDLLINLEEMWVPPPRSY